MSIEDVQAVGRILEDTGLEDFLEEADIMAIEQASSMMEALRLIGRGVTEMAEWDAEMERQVTAEAGEMEAVEDASGYIPDGESIVFLSGEDLDAAVAATSLVLDEDATTNADDDGTWEVEVGSVWVGITGNRCVIDQVNLETGTAHWHYVDDVADGSWDAIADIAKTMTLETEAEYTEDIKNRAEKMDAEVPAE